MARKKTASVCAPRRSCIIGAFGAATLLLGVLQLLGAFQEVLRGDRGGADRAALDTRGPAAPSEPKPQSAEETPKLPPPGAAAAARSRSEPSPKAVEAVCRCMQNGSAAPPRGYKAQELLDALEMMLVELRFSLRIFSYPVDVSDCIGWKTKQGGYMLDKIIYHRVQASRMRTMSPVAASIFYIPTFTHCWRDQVENHVQGGLVAAMRMRTLLSNITRDFDYADFKKRHFWVSTHDMGKPEVLSFVGEDFAASASALVNTADALDRHKMYDPGKVGNGTMIKVRSPYAFDPRSDVALACNGRVERAEEARKRARKPREPRKYSVFFAGKAGGGRWAAKVRSAVLESLKKAADAANEGASRRRRKAEPEELSRKLPAPWGQMLLEAHLEPEDYTEALADSDFCLAPRGARVWSPRLFEAIWFGCIPVILADSYHLPGSCFWDWSQLAVRIPEAEAATTAQVLERLRADKKWMVETRKRLFRVREHLMWSEKENRGDAFELAMLDVYVKKQRTCAAAK
eukprot:TRINITY_DN25978_c0_g1_i1.p1 TRINITY_DN25978_c0_g1~~TRINITY_DN25978_c0_g1_i1.p1  ORF type:complete len:516 (-),score=129.69 TRINITY_DN25978_c0_g1_i1:214-1761(-)